MAAFFALAAWSRSCLALRFACTTYTLHVAILLRAKENEGQQLSANTFVRAFLSCASPSGNKGKYEGHHLSAESVVSVGQRLSAYRFVRAFVSWYLLHLTAFFALAAWSRSCLALRFACITYSNSGYMSRFFSGRKKMKVSSCLQTHLSVHSCLARRQVETKVNTRVSIHPQRSVLADRYYDPARTRAWKVWFFQRASIMC